MVANSKNIQGVNKFAVKLSPKKSGLHSGKAKKSTSSGGQNDFFLSSAPKIPECSKELKSLLNKFLSESSETKQTKIDPKESKRKKTKSTKSKKFNGFFAFRSYYSKSINNVVYQRSLSKKLANLWAIEPNQDVWNRYAIEYNRSLDDSPFCEWLEKTLNGPVWVAKTSKVIQENTNSNNNTPTHLEALQANYIMQMDQLFENKGFLEDAVPGIYNGPMYNHSVSSNLDSISPMLTLKIKTVDFFEPINSINTADHTSLEIQNWRSNEITKEDYSTRKNAVHNDKFDMEILSIDPNFFNLFSNKQV